MGRPRTAKHPKPAEIPAEDENQDVPDEDFPQEPANDNQPSTQAISKADMVRAGLAEGLTKPGDISEFVERKFGVLIPKPMVSSYAAQERARERRAETGEAAPRRRSQPVQQASIPPSFGSDVKELRRLIEMAGGADSFREWMGGLSTLLAKYGKDGIESLAEALG